MRGILGMHMHTHIFHSHYFHLAAGCSFVSITVLISKRGAAVGNRTLTLLCSSALKQTDTLVLTALGPPLRRAPVWPNPAV